MMMMMMMWEIKLPYLKGRRITSSKTVQISIQRIPGSESLAESISNLLDILELTNLATWLQYSTQSLVMPPARVLCEGTHPTGGSPTTPIFLAPKLYNSYQNQQVIKCKGNSQQHFCFFIQGNPSTPNSNSDLLTKPQKLRINAFLQT